MEVNTKLAMTLLSCHTELLGDARTRAAKGHSFAGTELTHPLRPIRSRRYAERAVMQALRLLEQHQRRESPRWASDG